MDPYFDAGEMLEEPAVVVQKKKIYLFARGAADAQVYERILSFLTVIDMKRNLGPNFGGLTTVLLFLAIFLHCSCSDRRNCDEEFSGKNSDQFGFQYYISIYVTDAHDGQPICSASVTYATDPGQDESLWDYATRILDPRSNNACLWVITVKSVARVKASAPRYKSGYVSDLSWRPDECGAPLPPYPVATIMLEPEQ